MPIKHIWSVLCKESIINQEDNSLSLRDLLESVSVRIQKSKVPKDKKMGIPLSYEIVSLFFREEASEEVSCELELRIVDNKQKELFNKSTNFSMPIGMRRMRTRMRVSGLQVEDTNEYLFKVFMKELGNKSFVEVASIPLDVFVTFFD